MNPQTRQIAFCRSYLPMPLANQFLKLKRNLRGRTIAFIIIAHTRGLDVQKLIEAASEMRRLGVLINQSLRVSRGTSVDINAVESVAKLIKGMFP